MKKNENLSIRQRAGRKSINKGKKGEREACQVLNKIFGRGRIFFKRSPHSGAWSHQEGFSADVLPFFVNTEEIDREFPLLFEVKRTSRDSFGPSQILEGSVKRLIDWLIETKTKAPMKVPVVLWRADRTGWQFVFFFEDFSALFKEILNSFIGEIHIFKRPENSIVMVPEKSVAVLVESIANRRVNGNESDVNN